MSLVDYASSSEDEHEKINEEKEEKIDEREEEEEEEKKLSLPPPDRENQNFITSSSHQPCNGVSPLPPPQTEKLPDASFLFSSPSSSSHQNIMSDHSSRVAAAFAASESRKRESNGSSLVYPRSKQPKGSLPHSRNMPDTVSSQLIPPQLRGRSNVVTEDISKLFVRKDGQKLPGRN